MAVALDVFNLLGSTIIGLYCLGQLGLSFYMITYYDQSQHAKRIALPVYFIIFDLYLFIYHIAMFFWPKTSEIPRTKTGCRLNVYASMANAAIAYTLALHENNNYVTSACYSTNELKRTMAKIKHAGVAILKAIKSSGIVQTPKDIPDPEEALKVWDGVDFVFDKLSESQHGDVGYDLSNLTSCKPNVELSYWVLAHVGFALIALYAIMAFFLNEEPANNQQPVMATQEGAAKGQQGRMLLTKNQQFGQQLAYPNQSNQHVPYAGQSFQQVPYYSQSFEQVPHYSQSIQQVPHSGQSIQQMPLVDTNQPAPKKQN